MNNIGIFPTSTRATAWCIAALISLMVIGAVVGKCTHRAILHDLKRIDDATVQYAAQR
jgi:hypothetical protein